MNSKQIFGLVFFAILCANFVAMPEVGASTPQSFVTVTVDGDKFHVDMNIEFVKDGNEDQFGNVVDAKDREPNNFHGELSRSLAQAISNASGKRITKDDITDLNTRFVNAETKFYAEISFDLAGFIATDADGRITYDLSWRTFKVDKKLEVETTRGTYQIDASEAMALNFEDFGYNLQDWNYWEQSAEDDTLILKRNKELSIDVDGDGKINLNVLYKIEIPNRLNLTINGDKIVYTPAGAVTERKGYIEQILDWIRNLTRPFGIIF